MKFLYFIMNKWKSLNSGERFSLIGVVLTIIGIIAPYVLPTSTKTYISNITNNIVNYLSISDAAPQNETSDYQPKDNPGYKPVNLNDIEISKFLPKEKLNSKNRKTSENNNNQQLCNNYKDIDTDGDSISDIDECISGLNPNYSDTDGDGHNDDVEIYYETDPADKYSFPLFWTVSDLERINDAPHHSDVSKDGILFLYDVIIDWNSVDEAKSVWVKFPNFTRICNRDDEGCLVGTGGSPSNNITISSKGGFIKLKVFYREEDGDFGTSPKIVPYSCSETSNAEVVCTLDPLSS